VSFLRPKHLPLVYSLLLAVLVFSMSFVVALHDYYEKADDIFHATAEEFREEIGKRLGGLEQITRSLARFELKGEFNSANFAQHIQMLLKENLEIDYIAYAQRVEYVERENFEAKMREVIHPNFTIIEQGLNAYQAARIRDQYFSLLALEPINEQSEQDLGLDIYVSAVYRNAILTSLQSGNLVVVQPLRIARDTAQGLVMMDLVRHFQQNNSIQANPWSGVKGALLVKVNLARFLAGIKVPDSWELIYDDDIQNEWQERIFPYHLTYRFSPNLSNYSNRINIVLRAPLSFKHFVGTPLVVTLFVAVLIFVAIQLLIRFVFGRNDDLLENNLKVQALVEAKTNELEQEKALLQAEIEERTRLEKQSIYFGRILDQTSNEIYMFSTDTLRFVKVNQGALKNIGYTMEEMRLMTPFDIKPDFNKDSFRNMIAPLLEGRQSRLVVETRHQRKDGSCYSVEVRLQIVHGDPPIFVAVIEDISERQRTSEKMRKLSSALEASQDIVFITDKHGVIEYVNPAFETSTGYSAEDALGRRPNLLNSFKQDSVFYHRLWGTIASGQHFQGTIINRKKSGELYYEEKTITPIRNDKGEICNYVSTGRDVTEREMARQQLQEKNKQLEMEIIERESVQAELRKHRAHLSELVDQRTLELAKARDEAIEANSAKTRFLMNMSHELRTPLNAIIGYSELLKEELQENGADEFIQDIEKISLSGNHLLGLINDLLDLSRVEVGKLELEAAAFSLPDLVKSVEYAVQPLMAKNKNRFIIHGTFDNLVMIGDVKRIRQILVNLAANAGKFTQDGEVSLSIRPYQAKQVEWMEFKISDNGIGIARDKIKNLFHEFIQADENISVKYGGTGLGLAISKKLCESMGGDITVQSEIGAGSVFTINLPQGTPANFSGATTSSMTGS